MFVAAMFHLGHKDGLLVASHAIECFIMYIGFTITGPGVYAVYSFVHLGKK